MHDPPSQADAAVPSTSVIAGPPEGPVSPRTTPAYDDPLAHDMRAQAVGGSGIGHGGILGCGCNRSAVLVRRTR